MIYTDVRINLLHFNILCKLHQAPLRVWEGVGGGWGERKAQRRSCVGSQASGPQSDASGIMWTFIQLYINTPPTSLTISVSRWPLMWKMAAVTWGCSLVAHSDWRGASCDSRVWCQCDTAVIIKAAGYNDSARSTRWSDGNSPSWSPLVAMTKDRWFPSLGKYLLSTFICGGAEPSTSRKVLSQPTQPPGSTFCCFCRSAAPPSHAA